MPVKKKDQFDVALLNIEKSVSKGKGASSIIKKASSLFTEGQRVISFGYPDVDDASYCGGVGRGKIVEIFGPESGGKSFLTLKLIASAQKSGLVCCLVDAEKSFDPDWAKSHGVDIDELYIITEDLSAEKTLDYVVEMCKSGQFGLIVIDSTAAMVPEKEIEGSVGDQDYALLARALSKGLRKIVQYAGTTGTTTVFINQIREKMGVMFGDPTTTPGGKALKFYSHQRISVYPGTKVKQMCDGKELIVARRSKVKFVKNKMARPYGECEIEIVFDPVAMNPLVKLSNICKNSGLIRLKDGEWTLSKNFINEIREDKVKANVQTGAKTPAEFAEYLKKEDLVSEIGDYIIEKTEADASVKRDVKNIIEDISKEILTEDCSDSIIDSVQHNAKKDDSDEEQNFEIE